jgi:hypothetical protein
VAEIDPNRLVVLADSAPLRRRSDTIGPNTRVTIASASAIVGALLAGVAWIDNSLDNVEATQRETKDLQATMGFRLDMIEYRLGVMEKKDDERFRTLPAPEAR